MIRFFYSIALLLAWASAFSRGPSAAGQNRPGTEWFSVGYGRSAASLLCALGLRFRPLDST